MEGGQIPICPEAVGIIALATGIFAGCGCCDNAVKAVDNITTKEDFKYIVGNIRPRSVL